MGMVDIHTHVLPGIDDGPKSWEIALEMCRMAAEDGTTHIVATPHANDVYTYDRTAHQKLLDELASRVPDISFTFGCDCHLSYENIKLATEQPKWFSIGQTRYMLVEFSDYGSARSMPDALFELHSAGLRTIVTHPERNAVLQRHPDMVRQFAEMGCVIQVTANSLLGFWGRGPQRMSEDLLKAGLVHVLASDAHSATGRVPLLREAVAAAAEIVGAEKAEALVQDNPRAIIEDRDL